MIVMMIVMIVLAGEPAPPTYDPDPLAILESRVEAKPPLRRSRPRSSRSHARLDGLGGGMEAPRGRPLPTRSRRHSPLPDGARECRNPNAQNPSSGASGLFQVLPSWADNFGVRPVDLFVPEINTYIARQLYDDGDGAIGHPGIGASAGEGGDSRRPDGRHIQKVPDGTDVLHFVVPLRPDCSSTSWPSRMRSWR